MYTIETTAAIKPSNMDWLNFSGSCITVPFPFDYGLCKGIRLIRENT